MFAAKEVIRFAFDVLGILVIVITVMAISFTLIGTLSTFIS